MSNREIDVLLKAAFERGRALLEERDYPTSELQMGNIKDLLLVVQLDLVACHAELTVEDPVNGRNVAHGCE